MYIGRDELTGKDPLIFCLQLYYLFSINNTSYLYVQIANKYAKCQSQYLRFALDGMSGIHRHLHHLFTYSQSTMAVFFSVQSVSTSGFIQICRVDPAWCSSVLSSGSTQTVVFLIFADDLLVKRLSLQEVEEEGGLLLFGCIGNFLNIGLVKTCL